MVDVVYVFVCLCGQIFDSVFVPTIVVIFYLQKSWHPVFFRLSSNYLDQVRALADIDEHVEEGHVYDIIVKVFLEATFIETHIIALKQKW